MVAMLQLTAPVKTSKQVLTTHYDISIVTTSKEYLINSHILLKYFNSLLLQLQR